MWLLGFGRLSGNLKLGRYESGASVVSGLSKVLIFKIIIILIMPIVMTGCLYKVSTTFQIASKESDEGFPAPNEIFYIISDNKKSVSPVLFVQETGFFKTNYTFLSFYQSDGRPVYTIKISKGVYLSTVYQEDFGFKRFDNYLYYYENGQISGREKKNSPKISSESLSEILQNRGVVVNVVKKKEKKLDGRVLHDNFYIIGSGVGKEKLIKELRRAVIVYDLESSPAKPERTLMTRERIIAELPETKDLLVIQMDRIEKCFEEYKTIQACYGD